MGSRDCSAAAACSQPAISPVPPHDVPDAADDDCESDARQITPKGLHVLCPYCPYSRTPKYWARTDHFHAHMRVDHPDEPIPDPDGYTCPCHGRPFASRWEMNRHIIGKSRATCPHCGRGVARASFRRHVGNCRHNPFPPKKHGCDTCGRFFLSALGTRATVAQPATPKQTHRRSKETRANRTPTKRLHLSIFGNYPGVAGRSAAAEQHSTVPGRRALYNIIAHIAAAIHCNVVGATFFISDVRNANVRPAG